LEVIERWINSRFFSTILKVDLIVDTFFWIGAFLASYQMLTSMSVNEGKLPSSKFKIYLNRVVRLLPLYLFAMLFFWRIVVLFGGDGPMFF